MDRHQPAEHRLDVRVHEPCLGDHAFEGRHVGEAADRFDQIAIAVLVMREQLADLGDDLVRIGVVDLRESGPQGGRERSEEHTSELQSLMRISYAVFCLKKKKETSNKNMSDIYIKEIKKTISTKPSSSHIHQKCTPHC